MTWTQPAAPGEASSVQGRLRTGCRIHLESENDIELVGKQGMASGRDRRRQECVMIRPMILAEAFVLLALDADGSPARGASNQPAAAVGVTGALITELVQQGQVSLAGGRIHLTGSRPEHPLLVQTLDNLARHEGRKLKGRLASVKHAGWKEVVSAMIEEGLLDRVKNGMRATRHPVIDAAAQVAILTEVRAAAAGDGPMDARTAALLALAGRSQLLEVVAPERADRAHARQRIAQAAEQVPAAAAVKCVIESMQAAMTVAVVGSAVAGGN